MIPKIRFIYSTIYDNHWKENAQYNPTYKIMRNEKYPSQEEIKKYMKKIQKEWGKIEGNILKELAKIAHLKWSAKYIRAYVVGYATPFSDPLTIPIYPNNFSWFIDVLTHELIHQLFFQKGNDEKTRKAWNYFFKRYSRETERTIIHIPLHAIHAHIYKKYYPKERFEREINIMKRFPDYKRSWDIVMQETPEKILTEWRKHL
jgi:hypothetical protein